MKRNKIKLAVVGLLALSLLALPVVSACAKPAPAPSPAPAPAPAPAPKVYKWQAASFLKRGLPSFMLQEQWTDMVREASGGRIDITLAGSGELMPLLETWEAVAKGILQVNISTGGYWLGKTNGVSAFSSVFPYTVRDQFDHYAIMHQLGVEELLRKVYAKHNIHYLRVTSGYDASVLTKFPVTKAADFKGRKLRAMGPIAEVLAEAGASIIFLPGGEIYGALEKGVIDGCAYGPVAVQYDLGFHEVTNNIVTPPISAIAGEETHVNLDVWKELPDDLKEVLHTTLAAYNELQCALSRHDNVVKQAKMVNEAGLTVTYMPAEEQKIMAKHAVAVMDKYAAKDADFAEIEAIIKDYMSTAGMLPD